MHEAKMRWKTISDCGAVIEKSTVLGSWFSYVSVWLPCSHQSNRFGVSVRSNYQQ